MKVWLIFIQEERGETTWLEAAWDDESTAENPEGWQKEVDRCRELADRNDYEMRVASATIPGVHGLFETPELHAVDIQPNPEAGGMSEREKLEAQCPKCKGHKVLDRFGDDGRFVGTFPCPACKGTGALSTQPPRR